MIVYHPNLICERAKSYYYEYLGNKGQKCIPVKMLSHIDQCRHCQAEVNRLKSLLADLESGTEKGAGQISSAAVDSLKLHFAYTGTSVTCKTVRPFLPSLADPFMEIGIPTPITVHIDKCQQCADDLETIRQLNLTHEQLCRLGQLFAEKPSVDAMACAKGRNAIPSVVEMIFSKTSAETLKHLCICPDCRKLLYKSRQVKGQKLVGNTEQSLPCEAILAAGIFDYCFPYGIDPAVDQYVQFRAAFISHVSACPACLGKMQQLHNVVCCIAERRESGVVTLFRPVDSSARNFAISDSNDVYEDWPIEIRVFGKAGLETGAPADHTVLPRFTQKFRQRLTKLNIEQFIKPAGVAAVVLLAAILLLNAPVVRAVGLSQIYKAFERISNVYIATFSAREAEPTQQIWISRVLGIKIFTGEGKCVLWDINSKSRRVKDFSTGSITMAKPAENTLAKIEEAIRGPAGLLPFDDISELPEDAKWQQVADKNIEAAIPNTQVYDLTWMRNITGGGVIYRKWRGYIDQETKRPSRVEWWLKHTEKGEYELEVVMKVIYPATSDVQRAITEAGF